MFCPWLKRDRMLRRQTGQSAAASARPWRCKPAGRCSFQSDHTAMWQRWKLTLTPSRGKQHFRISSAAQTVFPSSTRWRRAKTPSAPPPTHAVCSLAACEAVRLPVFLCPPTPNPSPRRGQEVKLQLGASGQFASSRTVRGCVLIPSLRARYFADLS